MTPDVWNKVRDLRPEELPAVLAELDSCGLFPAPEETLEQFRSRLGAMFQELEAIRNGSSELQELIGQAPPVSGELRRKADQLTWAKYRFRAGWIPAWYSTRQTGFFSVGILLEVDRRLPLLFLHGGFRRRKVRRGYGAAETMAHELVHAVRCAFPASAYEEFFPCRMSGSRFRRMVGNLFRRWYLPALLFGGIAYVLQTMDTSSVATGVNMAMINFILPAMALATFCIHIRDLVQLIRRPASSFTKGNQEG